MFALPGLFLTTAPSLDALAKTQEEVKCGVDFSLLQLGFCMTYNSTTDITGYGPCPYVIHYNATSLDSIFLKLPVNVSLLNDFMC